MKNRIAVIVICVLILVTAVTGTLLFTDVFHFVDRDEFFGSESQADEQAISNSVDTVFQQLHTSFSFNKQPVGTFIDLENLYIPANDLLAFEEDVEAAGQMYCRTYFLKPSLVSNSISSGGVRTDLITRLAEITTDATIILTVDNRFFLKDNSLQLETLRAFLDTYPVHGILLRDSDFFTSAAFLTNVKSVSSMLHEQYPSLLFGCSVFSEGMDDTLSALVRNNNLDFLVFEDNSAATPLHASYKELCLQNVGNCLFFTLIDNAAADFSEKTLSDLSAYPYIASPIFSTPHCSEAARLSAATFYYEAEEAFLIQNIIPDQQNGTLTLEGTSASGKTYFCNDKKIESIDGDFSYKFQLHAGKNELRIMSDGKRCIINTELPSPLIYSCYPGNDNLKVATNEPIHFYAVCLSNALVSLGIGTQSYPLTTTNEYPDEIKVPDGYAVYSCSLSFDKTAQLGACKITAAAEGSCQISFACRELIVDKKDTSPFAVKIITDEDNEMDYKAQQGGYSCSYCTDYSLGSNLMCTVTSEGAEQLILGVHDNYQPTASSLIQGSWDYISDIVSNEAGYVIYKLESGAQIQAKDAALLMNANRLPTNTIALAAINETDPEITELALKVDWPVAVTTQLNGQTYEVGYSSYGYNVPAFEAAFLDITFPHTSQAIGFDSLQFGLNSIFSSAQVIQAAEDQIVLRLAFKETGKYYGSELRYDEKNGMLFLTAKNNANKSLLGKTVLLDPGHGGYYMTGTALQDAAVAEKEITLSVAYKLKQMLENRGAKVIMTRYGDVPVSLEERLALSDEINPSVFISLHCDGMEDESYSGTHSFYYTNFSQPLADHVHNSLVSYYRNYIYTAGTEEYEAVDYGIKYYPFAMIRSFKCPSILVEMGFMSNETEGFVLTVEDAQYWIAEAIAVGIGNYFSANS